jgi:hypothetical protein
MSTNTAGAFSSHDDAQPATIEISRDELRAIVREETADIRNELQNEREARREDRHALARETHELRSELHEYRSDNERDKADIRSSLHSLKEAVKPAIGMAESHKIDGEGGVQSEQTTTRYRESPIEQVCGFPEEMARKQLTQNEQRAQYIALRIKSFATNPQQGGFSLKSHKIKHILDEYDTSSHTETVSRVMDFLKDFDRDSEIKTKITEDGKKLVWFDIDLVNRLSEIVPEQSTASNAPVVIGSRG